MNLRKKALKKLKERGIDLEQLIELIYNSQKIYNNSLTKESCRKALNKVLEKREVLHTILTGIAIDEAVEKELFDKEINTIILEDKKLYGIDEILALSIVNVYGTIALTNFGYFDKTKPGIIGIIDQKNNNKSCQTFLDDILCALVASSCAKLAHQEK